MSVNRDALLIHLKDLRTLETIINESTDKKNKLTERVNNAEFVPKSTPEKPKMPDHYIVEINRKDLITAMFIAFIVLGVSIVFSIIVAKPLHHDWLVYDSFQQVGLDGRGFRNRFIVKTVCCALILIVIWSITFVKCKRSINDYKDAVRNYKRQVEEYPSKKKKYDEILEEIACDNEEHEARFIEVKKSMSDLAGEISVDIEHYKDLLNKAYSADIIPMQFRNIEGVYYLYDFLSTSQLSLSDAIINANMQEIRNKLDEVINMQKEMVIQQARSNAQIADLRETTEQVLESARITEQNTFVAAQYARISAINSELSLNLQSEQLAYQKADFWIK